MQNCDPETAPSTPLSRPEPSPQIHQSETWEDTTHPNPAYHLIIIRINLPKQIFPSLQMLTKFKQDKVKHFEAKESQPEFINLKERAEAYKRMDDKSKEQEKRKQSSYYLAAMDIQQHNMVKEKMNFPMFEGFEDRGKTQNIKFSHKKNRATHQNCLQVRLRKCYVLDVLKLSRNAILALPASFVNTWQTQLFGMIKVIYKLSNDSEKSPFYNLFIKSIDLISITFDIQYGDKRIYRFRYSPFEFRSGLFFKDNTQLSGYNQNVSMIPEISNYKIPVLDSEFYLAQRCFIFDDLTDFNMALKILQRTNLFYMAYSISKGNTLFYPGPLLDSDEYFKKCLWNIYFSTTRLKKFIYTWSFRPYKKPKIYNDEVISPYIDQEVLTKEIIFHTTFYVEVKDDKNMSKEDPLYRIRIQYHQPTKDIPLSVKEQIISRTKDWYAHFRGNRENQQDKLYQDTQRIQQYRKREGDREPEKPDREENELQIAFSNKDRFDRFLLGFLVIVSTIIDRNFFTMLEDRLHKGLDESSKIVVLDTQQIPYLNDRQGYMYFYHWLEIHLEHKILPYLFSKEEKGYSGHNKSHDMRIKCGEWRLNKICKTKREWNKKSKKESRDGKGQEVPQLPEIFREYVDILLRHFPLRAIYKDIISFVQGVVKNCYQGWQESNDITINIKNKDIFVPIISAIRYLYYSAPLAAFKEKDERNREKIMSQQSHSERHSLHERLSEEERARRDDRLIDQFSRVVVIKILNKGDPGFMMEERLMAEVTFRLMEFKHCWMTTVREGVIMLRVFEDRLQFMKDYQLVQILKYQQRGKGLFVEESWVKEVLQKLSVDFRYPLIL